MGEVLFPVSDLAGFLLGRWVLEREITSPEGELWGTFSGVAEVTGAEPGVVVFRERGELRWGSVRSSAYRTLRYSVVAPGRAEVFFDHGGFFHFLDLRSGLWRAEHPCSADVYRGEFRVLSADRWRQRWDVAGPTKNHVLRTELTREDAG